jgi:hypothetical protein
LLRPWIVLLADIRQRVEHVRFVPNTDIQFRP